MCLLSYILSVKGINERNGIRGFVIMWKCVIKIIF